VWRENVAQLVPFCADKGGTDWRQLAGVTPNYFIPRKFHDGSRLFFRN
jgi:hypothetical protein